MTTNQIESHSEQVEALHSDFSEWWTPTWNMLRSYCSTLNEHDARHIAWLSWLSAHENERERRL
jgi:hypothetical protein